MPFLLEGFASSSVFSSCCSSPSSVVFFSSSSAPPFSSSSAVSPFSSSSSVSPFSSSSRTRLLRWWVAARAILPLESMGRRRRFAPLSLFLSARHRYPPLASPVLSLRAILFFLRRLLPPFLLGPRLALSSIRLLFHSILVSPSFPLLDAEKSHCLSYVCLSGTGMHAGRFLNPQC